MSTELTPVSGELTQIQTAQPAMLRPVAQVQALADIHREIAEVVASILEEDLDYGPIPGTGTKPSLLKPGAERLAAAFGMAPSYRVVESEVDHDRPVTFSSRKWCDADPPLRADGKQDDELVTQLRNSNRGRFQKRGERSGGGVIWQWQVAEVEEGESLGLYRYVVECVLTARATGEVVGAALGSCSTMETRYIRTPRDCENTVLKMASKRALVAAVLNTLSLSSRFTQDLEDSAGYEQGSRARTQRPSAPRERSDDSQPARNGGGGQSASPARFPGTCSRCGERYDEGDPIFFEKRDDGKWDRWHETCPVSQANAPERSDQDAVRLIRTLIARLDNAPDRPSIRACGRDLHRALSAALADGRIRPDGATERDARAAMDRALLRREAMREAEAVRGPSQDDPWADDVIDAEIVGEEEA